MFIQQLAIIFPVHAPACANLQSGMAALPDRETMTCGQSIQCTLCVILGQKLVTTLFTLYDPFV